MAHSLMVPVVEEVGALLRVGGCSATIPFLCILMPIRLIEAFICTETIKYRQQS